MFVGGGTPSRLAPDLLTGILADIALAPNAEVTVECNPDDITVPLLEAYRHAGVNRISIGVQSTVPHVLAALGRTHDPAAVQRAAAAVGEAGFSTYNVDLVYGAAGESEDDWARSVDDVLGLEPQPPHVSAYGLTVEAGTPLAADRARYPDDDDQAAKYDAADDALAAAGVANYEISNWARAGHECRHNGLYWSQGDYRGIGCAAHSHAAGRRWWNVRTPERYIEAIRAGLSAEGGAEDARRRDSGRRSAPTGATHAGRGAARRARRARSRRSPGSSSVAASVSCSPDPAASSPTRWPCVSARASRRSVETAMDVRAKNIATVAVAVLLFGAFVILAEGIGGDDDDNDSRLDHAGDDHHRDHSAEVDDDHLPRGRRAHDAGLRHAHAHDRAQHGHDRAAHDHHPQADDGHHARADRHDRQHSPGRTQRTGHRGVGQLGGVRAQQRRQHQRVVDADAGQRRLFRVQDHRRRGQQHVLDFPSAVHDRGDEPAGQAVSFPDGLRVSLQVTPSNGAPFTLIVDAHEITFFDPGETITATTTAQIDGFGSFSVTGSVEVDYGS